MKKKGGKLRSKKIKEGSNKVTIPGDQLTKEAIEMIEEKRKDSKGIVNKIKTKSRRKKKIKDKIKTESVKKEGLNDFLNKPIDKKSAIFFLEIIVSLVAIVVIFFLIFSSDKKTGQETNLQKNVIPIEENQENITTDQDNEQKAESAEANKIDTTNWETYTNKYYGFQLKYPSEWNKVITERFVRGTKWTKRYQFRKKEMNENNPYLGFDVVIYDVQKVKELSGTDEFPKLKAGVHPSLISCQTLEGHLEENPDYPAEEIYIPPQDDCFDSNLFYSLTKDEYIYNVIPVYAKDFLKTDDLRAQALKDFPEFFASMASFELIDIARPKTQPAKPKTPSAPKPVSAKSIGGKLVCAKSNDKPGNSKTNKHKHLDMECCLDPDEYPNPWCSYDAKRYQKYIK